MESKTYYALVLVCGVVLGWIGARLFDWFQWKLEQKQKDKDNGRRD